ncbi:signal peptidase I [uncultured Enterococcus sp.]|uniref:signal peptidase I n=1 Tax=uncultured Enterococcus sp. TaxID=167972 RepID=UPI002AA652BF|nr:signal peptidase I [uncultured Enterococcus sp.]
MEPTFQENDRILLKKRQVVKRYEIITFQPKGVENTSYIKRVIGIPGDYIWVDGNSLFLLPEGGTERRAEAPTSSGDMLDNMLKITISDATAEELSQYKMIPKNQYFVQGDNRSHSNDSRDFGLVNSEQIEGVVCYRYFPFNKLGIPH